MPSCKFGADTGASTGETGCAETAFEIWGGVAEAVLPKSPDLRAAIPAIDLQEDRSGEKSPVAYDMLEIAKLPTLMA